MKVLHIYTRVSTSAQEDQGTSLQSQEEMGREAAARLGFTAQVWNEGGKSSNHEEISGRPVLQALYNEVIAGQVKDIFVYDASRLSRRDEVASQLRIYFKRHGVTLHTKDGKYDLSNPSDALLKQMLDAVAEFDNAARAARTRQGKLQRVRQGQWHGGPPPFGYTLLKKRLQPVEAEAEVVRNIFSRYVAGESIASIKAWLDRSGIAPRRNGLWSVGSINALLQNTHHVGYYHYTDKAHEESIRVDCAPVVSPDTWQAVQDRRNEILLRKGQVNRTKHFYLLRDLMYCEECSAPLGARTKPAKGEHFYYCPSKERRWKAGDQPAPKHSKKSGCGLKRSMNIHRADALVWEVVKTVHQRSSMLKEEVKRRLLEGVVVLPAEQEAVRKKREGELRAAQKKVKEADGALLDLEVERRLGTIAPEQVGPLMKRLQTVRDMAGARLDAIQRNAEELESERRWVDWVKAFGDEVRMKAELSPEEKKSYLAGMVNRINVRFLAESKEHQLEIVFRKPIVGDGITKLKPSGYQLREGKRNHVAVLGTSVEKRAAPVGNKSATVE